VHDPENRLFESAADLVDAAHRLARELQDPAAKRLLAPTFGCLEEALGALARASEEVASSLRRTQASAELLVEIERCSFELLDASHACGGLRQVSASTRHAVRQR
jgi:hypothetical protein